jgi:hypothetical protein
MQNAALRVSAWNKMRGERMEQNAHRAHGVDGQVTREAVVSPPPDGYDD